MIVIRDSRSRRSYWARRSALGRGGLGVTFATLAMLTILSPSTVWAAQSHAFSKAVGAGVGAGPGQLALVQGSATAAGSGLAVSSQTHDVYVADTGNNRVAEFTATGTFVRAWGWGVASGAAELQTCTTTCRRGLPGNAPGQLEAPTFVAVDNDPLSASYGDVYAAGPGQSGLSASNLVTKYDAEGALEEGWGVKGQLDGSTATAGPFGEIAGIAVDTTGNLWVYTGETGGGHIQMFEFAQDATFEQNWVPTHVALGVYSPQGVAVDGSGDLYVSKNDNAVEKLGATGGWLGAIINEEVAISGLAVDSSNEELYVGNAGSTILDIPHCEPFADDCRALQTFSASGSNADAGIAVDEITGSVYTANAADDRIDVFVVTVEANNLAASEVRADGAVLHGAVNPSGAELTRCTFEYGEATTSTFAIKVPCEESPSEIGSGTTQVQVDAAAVQLAGGTTYHYRLRATNANGDVRSVEAFFTTLPIAVVEATTATEVGPSTALLGATINPNGLATTYHFEYDTVPYGPHGGAHGMRSPALDEVVGGGNQGVAVSQRITGLAPETTYYFRVVATDSSGTAISPEHTFVFISGRPSENCGNAVVRHESAINPITGAPLSTELPDCRAYELVTPAQKNAALLTPITFGLPIKIAQQGSRVIGSSLQCFAQAESCTGDRVSKGPPFAFDRTDSGWVDQSLAPPASTVEDNSVWGYNADTGVVLYSAPIASHVTDEFFSRDPDGTLEDIGPIAEGKSFQSIAASPLFATASLSHVVYESNGQPLWPAFEESERNSLYEYAARGATRPLLVGVSGETDPGSTSLISVCGTALGSATSPAATEALSDDGRTIYFTAEGPCPRGAGVNSAFSVPANELYARVDGEQSDAHTVAISASQCGNGSQQDETACREAEARPSGAFLEGVSEDGSVAIFASTQQLTDTASDDGRAADAASSGGCVSTSGPNGCNLYLYDFREPLGARLVDISSGDSGGQGPQVQGVMAVSADGSHVYFVAKGVLSTNKSGTGQEAVEGADNLYVYAGGHTTFITMLPDTPVSVPRNEVAESTEWTSRSGPTANVTPDGRFLVFTSHGALTADTSRAEGPAQVFRYDAEDDDLVRVSIGEQGFNDNGNASRGEARAVAPKEGHVGLARRDPTMSDDGAYVFFQSPAALTPGALDDVALNGHGESIDLAQNVYEWEEEGKDGCADEAGCVHLISDGRDATEGLPGVGFSTASSVELIGSDATGENVFFTTADPLVRQDTDTQLDFYDARVGGGFAAPVTGTSCQGDECRQSAPALPTFGTLGSSTFSGPANILDSSTKASPSGPATKRPLTRAQKLAKALKICGSKRNKRKRATCVSQARKRYGAEQKAKRKSRSHGGASGKHK